MAPLQKTYSYLLDPPPNVGQRFSVLADANQAAIWSHTTVKPSMGYNPQDLRKRSAEIIFWINKIYRENKDVMTPSTRALVDKFRDKCCTDKTIPWTHNTVDFDNFESMKEITNTMAEITTRVQAERDEKKYAGVKSRLEELYREVWLLRHRDYLTGWQGETIRPDPELHKKLEAEANAVLIKMKGQKPVNDGVRIRLPKTEQDAIRLVENSTLGVIYRTGKAEWEAHQKGVKDTPLNELVLKVAKSVPGYKAQFRDISTDLRLYAMADEATLSPHKGLAQRGDWQGFAGRISADHIDLRCEGTGMPYKERGVVIICLAKRVAPLFKKLYIGSVGEKKDTNGSAGSAAPGCLDYEAWPCAKGGSCAGQPTGQRPVIITEGSKIQVIGPEHRCLSPAGGRNNRYSQMVPPAYETVARPTVPAAMKAIPWMVVVKEAPPVPVRPDGVPRRRGFVAEEPPAYTP
ncbi:hypothetical protein V8F20_005893 [Naviculisporaceae sp. PSN 640]